MDEKEFNRKAYDNVAELYQSKRMSSEGSAWNDFLEVPAINSILEELVEGKRVLDLGCGTGLLTKEIIDWGGNPCGIDQSEKMIRLAKRNIPNCPFHIGTIDKLPYQNKEFDVAASSLVMHYIKDLTPVFNEVSRVLIHEGDFVFSMHHPVQESFKKDKERQDGKPILQPYFNNDSYYWKMCGQEFLSYHHTFEDIIKSLKESGFALLDLVECRPAMSVKDKFGDYDFTSHYPTFCVFHAKKLT